MLIEAKSKEVDKIEQELRVITLEMQNEGRNQTVKRKTGKTVKKVTTKSGKRSAQSSGKSASSTSAAATDNEDPSVSILQQVSERALGALSFAFTYRAPVLFLGAAATIALYGEYFSV